MLPGPGRSPTGSPRPKPDHQRVETRRHSSANDSRWPSSISCTTSQGSPSACAGLSNASQSACRTTRDLAQRGIHRQHLNHTGASDAEHGCADRRGTKNARELFEQGALRTFRHRYARTRHDLSNRWSLISGGLTNEPQPPIDNSGKHLKSPVGTRSCSGWRVVGTVVAVVIRLATRSTVFRVQPAGIREHAQRDRRGERQGQGAPEPAVACRSEPCA